MQPEATQVPVRPDLDIEEDINTLLRTFAPLKAARPFLTYTSTNGKVTVSGNVGSLPARYVLLENIGKIPGVISCDTSAMYDDEQIRLSLGRFLPHGVFANVQYGQVSVIGQITSEAEARDLLTKIKNAPGVRKAVATFGVLVIEV